MTETSPFNDSEFRQQPKDMSFGGKFIYYGTPTRFAMVKRENNAILGLQLPSTDVCLRESELADMTPRSLNSLLSPDGEVNQDTTKLGNRMLIFAPKKARYMFVFRFRGEEPTEVWVANPNG